MVDRYLSPKFGINSFSSIRENDVYGRRTDNDGRPRDDSSSAVHQHKAELKTVASFLTNHSYAGLNISSLHVHAFCMKWNMLTHGSGMSTTK